MPLSICDRGSHKQGARAEEGMEENYMFERRRRRGSKDEHLRWGAEGKEYRSRISKLRLAQGSGLPLKQYNYKVGLKQTEDLVTNFLLAIASKLFLLVAGLLTKTVCLLHDGTYREGWF